MSGHSKVRIEATYGCLGSGTLTSVGGVNVDPPKCKAN
jgi:hypothetical protein